MTFDLMQIKDELEAIYEAEFKVVDVPWKGDQELVFQKGKHKVTVHLGNYTCYGDKFGKQFVGYDYWNGESGRSAPCDSMEELVDGLDFIKMPRRTTPRVKQEQLSLF